MPATIDHGQGICRDSCRTANMNPPHVGVSLHLGPLPAPVNAQSRLVTIVEFTGIAEEGNPRSGAVLSRAAL